MWINKDVAYLDNIIAEQEQVTQDIEVIDKYSKVRIYPFRIVSGTQLLTKQGEVDILTNINKEGQYANFYTGNDQITIVWEGSTTLNADNHNSTNNIKEELRVGRYIDLLASDEGLLAKNNNLSTVNLYGIDYTTTETQNTLSLFCDCSKDDQQTNKVWSFIQKDEFNTYLASSYVPTDYDIQNYVYLILDPRYQSYQWLRIKNVTYAYHNVTREPISALIEFETINNDFTNTGKSIIQYFQHGTPNSSYAFPIETYDKDNNIITSLDKRFIRTQDNDFEGVDSIQIDHLGGYALSSMGLLGRPIDKDNYFVENEGVYTRNIKAPQLLLLYDSLRIIESPFINRVPVQNVYAAYNMVNDVNGIWKSYKEAFGGNAGSLLGGYNVTATKQVITGMRPTDSDWDKIKATNPLNENHYSFNTWLTTGMNTPNWIKPLDNSQYVFGVPGFDAKSPSSLNISVTRFLNQNHIINWSIDELTTNYTESTKYKLSEVLGVFGNLFTTITGGLDIGWITQKTLATGQTFNVLLPTEIVSSSEAILPLKSDNATFPLTLDAFNDQNAAKALPIDSNLYTAYRFSLTHLFSTDQYGDNDINWIDPNDHSKNYGMGFNGVWDTKYIGQTTDENGRLLLTQKDNKVRPLDIDIYKMVPQKSDNNYIVDWISIKGIGICDRRVAMFKQDIPKYQLIAQTKSKVKNNITLWADSWKFNYYDQFNTFGNVKWPITPTVTPPPSTDTSDNRKIVLDKSVLYEKQVYESGNKLSYQENMKNAFGSSGLLWTKEDDLNVAVNKEKTFKNKSRISNLKFKVENDVTNSNSTDNQNLNIAMEYDLKDIQVTYNDKQWTQNDTFNNLVNLQELTFNTGINANPDNESNLSLIIPITLKRNETGSGELDNLLNGSTITKNGSQTFNVSLNDLPSNLIYPMSLAGDFLSSGIANWSRTQTISGKRRTFTDGSWNKIRWNWIFSPKTLLSSDNLTAKIKGQNGLSNFSSYNANVVSVGLVTMYGNILNFETPRHGKVPYYNKWTWNLNNQTRTQENNQVFNFVRSENYKYFHNLKPKFTNQKASIKLDYTITISVNNINKQLLIKYTNLHITINMSGVYNLENVKDSFNVQLLPQSIQITEPAGKGNFTINAKLQTRSIPNGITGLFEWESADIKDKIGQNNTGLSYWYSSWDGTNFKVQTTSIIDDPVKNRPYSAISPLFLFDNHASQNWSKWLNLSAEQIGNWTDNKQWIQEINNELRVDASLVYSQNGKNIVHMNSPIAFCNLKTTSMQVETAGGSGRDHNFVISGGRNFNFQYDSNINFQPLLALDLETKWKS